MYELIGVGTDDADLYSLVIEEVVDDAVQKFIPDSIKKKTSQFHKLQSEYWDEVHIFTDELANKYENTKMPGLQYEYGAATDNGKDIVASALRKSVDTSFMSYLYKHSDDWINDLDSKYDLMSEFTDEDYDQFLRKK